MQDDLIGRVASSKAGRDKGRTFLILGAADEACVWIADGRLRKAERPKKKKRMHLRMQPVYAEEIRAILLSGKIPSDAEIRKALAIVAPDTNQQE